MFPVAPILLLSAGLLAAGSPTTGLEVEGVFIYGTNDGEIVAEDPRGAATFAVRVSDRAVFLGQRRGSRLIAEDELGTILVFDLEQKKLRGSFHPSTPGSGNGRVVANAGQVYVEAPGGTWVAHDLESGKPRWRAPATGLASYGDELLYAGAENELRALAPSTGKPMYVLKLPGAARSSPAVDADGVLVVHASPDRKRKGHFIYGLSDHAHDAEAKARWTVTLGGAPVAAPVLCGSTVGVLLEEAGGGETRLLARHDRLDGRLIASDRLPASELALHCARDLFVASHRLPDRGRRLLAIAPAGGMIWERSDLDGWVGRLGDRFMGAKAGTGLVALSPELGARAGLDQLDIAAEITPAPAGVAARRFIGNGDELSLPVKASVSIRLRAYRGAVLEPSIYVSAVDDAQLPPGLRLSRDGLLFGRARGLGLHAVSLLLALPGRAQEPLSLAFRLLPRETPTKAAAGPKASR